MVDMENLLKLELINLRPDIKAMDGAEPAVSDLPDDTVHRRTVSSDKSLMTPDATVPGEECHTITYPNIVG